MRFALYYRHRRVDPIGMAMNYFVGNGWKTAGLGSIDNSSVAGLEATVPRVKNLFSYQYIALDEHRRVVYRSN